MYQKAGSSPKELTPALYKNNERKGLMSNANNDTTHMPLYIALFITLVIAGTVFTKFMNNSRDQSTPIAVQVDTTLTDDQAFLEGMHFVGKYAKETYILLDKLMDEAEFYRRYDMAGRPPFGFMDLQAHKTMIKNTNYPTIVINSNHQFTIKELRVELIRQFGIIYYQKGWEEE